MDPDDLYALPLDRFVPERTALAKALRQDGRREEAAKVAALRKPSVGAWAVNQLVRTQRRDVDRLFAAGDAVRQAQADLLDGRVDARALRTAAEGERAAVTALVDTARGLLTSGGHELSPAVLDRVADTLHAAGLDPGARDALGDGCLGRELVHVGLGGIPAGRSVPPPPKDGPEAPAESESDARPRPDGPDPSARPRPEARSPATGDSAEAKRLERAARAAEQAEAKRLSRERTAARREAQAAAAAAHRRLDRAERAVRTAEERREEAAQKLDDADAALAAARVEAEAAGHDHQQARAAAEAG